MRQNNPFSVEIRGICEQKFISLISQMSTDLRRHS
jgi:hypothetical protein